MFWGRFLGASPRWRSRVLRRLLWVARAASGGHLLRVFPLLQVASSLGHEGWGGVDQYTCAGSPILESLECLDFFPNVYLLEDVIYIESVFAREDEGARGAESDSDSDSAAPASEMAEPAHVSWTWEERAQCLGTGTAGINWDQMLTFYDGMDDAMLGPGTLEILEVLGVRFRDSDAVFSEVILGQVFETIMKDGLTAVNASEAYSKIDGQATVILSPLARVLRLIVENSGLKRLAGEFKDWLVDSTCRLSTNLEHEGVCLELLEHLVVMESTDPPGALQLERLCSSGAASSSPRLVQSTLEMTNRLFDGSSIFVGSLLGLVLRHRVCPHIGGKAGEKWKTKPGDPLARRKIRELSGRVREVCAELLAKTAETLRQRKKDRAFMGWQKVSEEITNLPSIFNLSDQDALMVCIRAWPSYAAMVAIPDCPVLAKFNVIAKLMQDFLQMEEGSLRKEALLAWKEFGTFWIAQPGFNYKMLSILIR